MSPFLRMSKLSARANGCLSLSAIPNASRAVRSVHTHITRPVAISLSYAATEAAKEELRRQRVKQMAAAALLASSLCAIAASSLNDSVECEESKVFVPNAAVGVGFRQEVWKAKHPNVNILDLELPPVALVLTYMRDKSNTGAAFVKASNRLLRLLTEHALASLPLDEEAVVETPAGLKTLGVAHEDDVKLCLAPILYNRAHTYDAYEAVLLSAAPSDATSGHFVVDKTGSEQGVLDVVRYAVPEDISDRHVVLFEPEITSLEKLKLVLKKLQKRGVSLDKVTVTSFLIIPEVADQFSKEFSEASLVVCSVDSHVDAENNIVPGLAQFYRRYEEGLKAAQGNISAAMREVIAAEEEGSARAPEVRLTKTRRGWRRYLFFGPSSWEIAEEQDSALSAKEVEEKKRKEQEERERYGVTSSEVASALNNSGLE